MKVRDTGNRLVEKWGEKSLEQIGKTQTGSTPKTSNKANFGDFIPFIKPADFNLNGSLNYENEGLSHQGLSQARKVPENSVLMVCIGATIGKCGWCDCDVTTNQQINALTPVDGVSHKFVYYQMLTEEFQRRVLLNSGQATLPIINKSKWNSLTVRLPPTLSEQQRIVAILDEAIEGIATAAASAEKNLANARELFQSTLQSVFTQQGEGWVERKLEELCDIKHGFAFDGGDFATSADDGKPIVITPGNFTENGALSFTEKNTKRFTGSPPVDFIFNRGDLVVVMTDLSSKMKILGRPALIERDGVLHNQRIGRLVFNDNSLYVKFLYYFFMTKNYLDNIKRSATGTMVKHTAPKRILSNRLPYPSKVAEQQRIVAKLDELSAETQRLEAIYQQKLTALGELKKSILHQAFSGAL